MNRLIKASTVVISIALFSGCAVRPTAGLISTSVTVGQNATSIQSSAGKLVHGESDTCTSILGLFASGDCSISSAKKNSGITQVSTVDYHVSSFLGIYSSGTIYITGKTD